MPDVSTAYQEAYTGAHQAEREGHATPASREDHNVSAGNSLSQHGSHVRSTNHTDISAEPLSAELSGSAGRSADTSSGAAQVYDGLIVNPAHTPDSFSQATGTPASTSNSAPSPSSPAIVAYTSTGPQEPTPTSVHPTKAPQSSANVTALPQQNAAITAATQPFETAQGNHPCAMRDSLPGTTAPHASTAVQRSKPSTSMHTEEATAAAAAAPAPEIAATIATAAAAQVRTCTPMVEVRASRGRAGAVGLPALFIVPTNNRGAKEAAAPGVIVVDKKGLQKSDIAGTANLQVSRMHLCNTLLQVRTLCTCTWFQWIPALVLIPTCVYLPHNASGKTHLRRQ